jgi:DNA-binding XRE family transcriptional regulator
MNRKTAKSSFVDKPHIPVLGGIQPSIFDQFNTEENKENGFTDRMLISFPDLYVDKYSDNELDDRIVLWYDEYIVKFFDKVKREWVNFNQDDDIQPIKAILSPNAKKEWIRIFNKITEMQNSDAENEYMKSMLPKQKSYIPRFALLINAIWSYDVEVNDGSYSMVGPDAMLKAEKLSDYFINMSKKVKIEAQDKKEMKSIMQSDNSKNKFDKFKSLYKANKDMNRTQVAELMNVSRVTLNKWINKIDNENS